MSNYKIAWKKKKKHSDSSLKTMANYRYVYEEIHKIEIS